MTQQTYFFFKRIKVTIIIISNESHRFYKINGLLHFSVLLHKKLSRTFIFSLARISCCFSYQIITSKTLIFLLLILFVLKRRFRNALIFCSATYAFPLFVNSLSMSILYFLLHFFISFWLNSLSVCIRRIVHFLSFYSQFLHRLFPIFILKRFLPFMG